MTAPEARSGRGEFRLESFMDLIDLADEELVRELAIEGSSPMP
jgi:hypothetical protein